MYPLAGEEEFESPTFRLTVERSKPTELHSHIIEFFTSARTH